MTGDLFKPGVWRKMFPKAAESLLRDLEDNGDAILSAMLSVSHPVQAGVGQSLAWYLANVAEESAGLTKFEENMRYSAKRLCQVWPKRFPTLAAAAPYANNPEKLANRVYADRMGNGPESSGDGWRFRGRGPIQITGRAMYQEVDKTLGLNGQLTTDPDLAAAESLALPLMSAVYTIKDLGKKKSFEEMVRAINGGTTNMASRLSYLRHIEKILL
jgi:putative chitinase